MHSAVFNAHTDAASQFLSHIISQALNGLIYATIWRITRVLPLWALLLIIGVVVAVGYFRARQNGRPWF